MCLYRYSVDVNSPTYKKWLKELHQEDINLLGSVVERPQRALNMLFDIYEKSRGE
jgi:hypothetical protein